MYVLWIVDQDDVLATKQSFRLLRTLNTKDYEQEEAEQRIWNESGTQKADRVLGVQG